MRKSVFLVFFMLVVTLCSSQIKYKGIPLIKNYTTHDYHALSMTWDIVQDQRGIMYFATPNGLIEFDGVSWRTILVPNRSVIRSLEIDKNGRIYIGAQVELGYLEADATGSLHYVSLLSKIPEKERNFDDVWKIYDTNDGIIFQTNHKLYIYKDDKFTFIHSNTWFHTCYYINNTLYIRQQGLGLMVLKNGKLELIPNGERYSTSLVELVSILPYGKDKSLFINTAGLYVNSSESNKLLKLYPESLPVKCAAQLENNNIAIGTISKGLFVFDSLGNILQQINKSKGISGNAVLSIFEDRQGNLWLGLENGISYIEFNSPFRFFNDKLNINGTSIYTLLNKDKLYVGTNQGLHVADLNESTSPLDPDVSFNVVENTVGEVRGIFSIEDQIICGHHYGSFNVNEGKATKFSNELGGWIFKKFNKHKPYVLEGSYRGLTLWEIKNGKLVLKNKFYGFNESCRYIEEDEDGNIWVSHANKGIFKIRFNETLDTVAHWRHYGAEKGLPSDINNKVTRVGSRILFTTDKGVYTYDKKSDRFHEDITLTSLIGRTFIKGIFPDSKGNLWFVKENKLNKISKNPIEVGVLMLQSNGSYKLERIPFYKFSNIAIEHIEPINSAMTSLPNSEGILFSTPEGTIFYDPYFIPKNIKGTFSTMIRKVEDINKQDSLIFNGAYFNPSTASADKHILKYKFPYASNALRFSVSGNRFENIDKTEYQYFMKGLDNQWSVWTNKAHKEYTNLPEGKYIFHARAKNVHGAIATIATFEFSIRPPWYRTVYAYIAYALLSLLLIGLTIKIYTLRLRRVNMKLENIILQRTKELELQKNEIEAKNKTLEQNNKDLYELNKEKNYLLEIVSHDLRSPVNQIKGMVSLFKLTAQNLTEEQKETTVNIYKATERLTTMITNILNVSSIESKKVDLHTEKINLSELVPTITNTFRTDANAKKINLTIHIESNPIYSSIDKNYFTQIIENLISNAIKFSKYNKNIKVELSEINNKAIIKIKDEGPGISEADQKKLFGRFQKLSARPTAGEQSLGLGLSIVKKYVVAMNGNIYCNSVVGVGTTFVLEFEKAE